MVPCPVLPATLCMVWGGVPPLLVLLPLLLLLLLRLANAIEVLLPRLNQNHPTPQGGGEEFFMWLLTEKASFVTFFGQMKGGALWKLPKPNYYYIVLLQHLRLLILLLLLQLLLRLNPNHPTPHHRGGGGNYYHQ